MVVPVEVLLQAVWRDMLRQMPGSEELFRGVMGLPAWEAAGGDTGMLSGVCRVLC